MLSSKVRLDLDYGSNAKAETKKTEQRKNKDGPPRRVQKLSTVSHSFASPMRIARRQDWSLVVLVMVAAWVIASLPRHGSLRTVVILVIVVFVLLPV
jgi:hypothetical protein